jgi:formylglycine-generating enzyme
MKRDRMKKINDHKICRQFGFLLFIFLTSSFILPAMGKVKPVDRMVRVPAGYYLPFYITKGVNSVRIESFWMDQAQVTNAQFLEFVKANPEWSRSRVSPTLAEHGYLKQWASDFVIGGATIKDAPVVNVSWFAAHAYAAWVHKRLPTVNEWEYAALAPIIWPTAASASAKKELVLAWYAEPNTSKLPFAGSVNQNAYGVRDMFGSVWEWTEDFNSVIIPTDQRGERNANSTCGAGAIGTIDPTDYATFMRFAMRSSLQAAYTVQNVGFRCVKDMP